MESLFDTTATLTVPATSADNFGETTYDFDSPDSTETQYGRLQTIGSKERLDGHVGETSTHFWFTRPGATLDEEYRLTIGSDVYEITRINSRPGGTTLYQQAELRLIEND